MSKQELQRATLRRIRILQGQLGGLQRMIESGEECQEVLTQVAAIQAGLRGVGKVVVRHHLETCVTDELRGPSPEKTYDALMDIIYKLTK